MLSKIVNNVLKFNFLQTPVLLCQLNYELPNCGALQSVAFAAMV
jgi:hypothetical protein